MEHFTLPGVLFLGLIFVEMLHRQSLTAQLSEKDAMLVEVTKQRDDWKGKAERLIDAALVRAGAAHEPTMEARKPADRVASATAALTAAMSVTEIDSSKKRKDS